MKPVTDSDPRVPHALPSRGPLVLRFVCVVLALALVSCAGSPQQLPRNPQACSPAQDRPSCFYLEAPEHKHAKLIIFVHGVFGGAASTWGDPQSETFWPAMVSKDPRFAAYDVYLINYRTPFFGGATNVHETAGNELGRLMSRKVFERYDEIYVIAHSMGGLVTKSLLTRLNRGPDVALLRRVKGVVYLSTPAQGADVASLAGWFSLNIQVGNMEPAHLNTYIQSLEDQWIQLMEDRDKARAEFPLAYCAYETMKTGPVWVVPRELASSRCDGPLYSMPFNHLGMAEPTRSDDDPYLWAMGKIQEAGTSGVTRLKAATLLHSASASVLAGDYAAARHSYDESSALSVQVGDRQGQAHALTGQGDLESLLEHHDEARTAYTEARSLFKAVGERLGEANVLRGQGDLESKLGRNDEARTAYTEARSLFKVVGDRLGEANVLLGQGYLEFRLGRNDEARTAYTQARSLFKAVGDRRGEADWLLRQGLLESRLGRNDEARTAYTEARSLFKAVGKSPGGGQCAPQPGRLGV